MSALTDEARANFARMTEIPAEVWIWTAVVVVVLTIAAWVATDRDARRQRDRRSEPTPVRTCGATHGSLTCGRAANHAPDFHADWTHDTTVPIRWREQTGDAA